MELISCGHGPAIPYHHGNDASEQGPEWPAVLSVTDHIAAYLAATMIPTKRVGNKKPRDDVPMKHTHDTETKEDGNEAA